MIAKIQIKVGIRKYSNLKVVFWLFFHNSSTTKGHHRYDGIRTYTSPRDAEGITGHITAVFSHFPISFGSKNHIFPEYRPCWTEERKDIFKNKKVVRLALLNASLLTPKWLNYDTQTALSEV